MAGISLSDFFKEKRSASEIKSEILNEYFKAWAAILLKGQNYKSIKKILYVDLFSGPGLYENGSPSTPIKILNSIYSSKGKTIDYDNHVQTFFNDKNTKLINDLKQNITNLPYYSKLKFKPIFFNEPANSEILQKAFEANNPALTFIDPLGYGFTQEMLMFAIKKWGSDLFMLFNFNRIRAAIKNPTVEQNMLEIFGDYFPRLQEYYDKEKSPKKRELFIIETFQRIFEDKGFMTLKFRVNFPDKEQTSHYLFFISKVKLAITRAKEIMSKYSEYQDDGIPYFGANLNKSPLLNPDFNTYSINKLADSICQNRNDFEGVPIQEIYLTHNHKTNYIKGNYKDAIKILMDKNQIKLIDKNGKYTTRITYTAKVKFE